MLVVEYIVESTYPCLVYGLMAKATVRWASTWSEPFWASSSTTKTAICRQNRLRETPDQIAPRHSVLSHAHPDAPLAGTRSARVMSGRARNHKLRHLSGFLETGELLQEAVGAFDVGIIHVETAEHGIEVTLESLDPRLTGVGRRAPVGDELAIAAIANSFGGGLVPEISAGGPRN